VPVARRRDLAAGFETASARRFRGISIDRDHKLVRHSSRVKKEKKRREPTPHHRRAYHGRERIPSGVVRGGIE